MSVQTHFPHPPDTRMPQNPGGVDELGIHYEGPVLTGLLGVREAFKDQAAGLGNRRESNLPELGPGFKVEPVRPASPFAEANNHLLSVDPVMEAHRSQFGPPPSATYTHPEQYDPVLRFHLGMKPAHDPYEAQRKRRACLRSERDSAVKP